MKPASPTAAAELLVLAAIAVLAYAPSLTIPLIADDYPNISQARTWGAPAGLPTLLADAQFRLRATSYWTMCALWNAAGISPPVYHAASLLLHIFNTWLLLAVARTWSRFSAAAFFGAAFFAVHEGHQEAVMWFSAVNELLFFFFGLAALLCWLKSGAAPRRSWKLETAGAALFALALLSKESAVILLPLFVLLAPRHWKRLWPHALLTALALASIAASRGNSFRFSDGSFSLTAAFWIAWPQSFARLLWIWGWPALALLFTLAPREIRRAAWTALAWIGIALVPYSFLTYSTRIPSRQTYLASAGLALLFGLAAAHCRDVWPHRRRVLAAVFAIVIAHNTIYLWTKKRAQFLERAAPTSQLIALARRTQAPIYMQCFPLPDIVGIEAVRLAADRPPESLIWSAAAAQARPDAVPFCYRASRQESRLRGFTFRITDSTFAAMATNFFYVYALKDPRTSPALPFYIGKGTGSRAFDHLVTPDATRKYVRIEEILASGAKPMVDILVEDVTELQALRLEAELISAFGTIDSGGVLTNSVMPSGLGGKKRNGIVVPSGCVERAQLGLQLLKTAIVDLARANPEGITNSDAASLLGLRSDYRGKQKDYLSYSVLGLLLRERKLVREPNTHRHKEAE